MNEREQLQRETLEELVIYSDKLIPALELIIIELKSDMREDSEDFLNQVIIGINWEIEVYNQCISLFNKMENGIDKKMMISAVQHLGEVLSSGDQEEIANCFEDDFLPFLNQLRIAAELILV